MNDFEALANAVALEGRTVVDVGCGDGAFVRRLRKAGADALGVDIDVSHARQMDPEGRYFVGGAQALPLEARSVDVATLMRSLHHVPDPHSAFPELKRVVRDLVYIAEPLAEGAFFELMKPVDDETEVRAKAQEAIRASGFDHLDTIHYEVVMEFERLEQLRDMLLAADPTREARYMQLEPELRERFMPGAYPIPMRADILAPPR